MKTLLNLLWLVLAGFWLALAYIFAALLSVIFLVTIPFAVPALKLAGYALWPFGRMVVQRPDRDVALSTLGNVVWFIVAGWWLALLHLISGLILMITIIGIPLGVANIKRAGLAIAPYGKRIVSTKEFRSESPGDVTIVSVIKTDR